MNYEEIVQPQEFCVENIFKGTEYVVPIYQRNYSWTKDEIEQLLNDINDVSDGGKGKYYLGSLIVNQLGARRGWGGSARILRKAAYIEN